MQREADKRDKQHRVTALIAVAAIAVAILGIIVVRVAYLGSKDVTTVLGPEIRGTSGHADKSSPKGKERSLRHKAESDAAKSRWATGFQP